MQELQNIDKSTIFSIVAILFGSWLIISLSEYFLPRLGKRLSHQRWNLLLHNSVPVIRLLVIMISLVLILSHVIEPTFEKVVAVFGAMAVALGFAFKDYISNLIAGIVSLYETSYRLGDWIEINNTMGKIRAVNLRTLELATTDGSIVYVPHLKIWNDPIKNYNDGHLHLRAATDFYLNPDHNPATVKYMLMDVALTSPYVQLTQPISITVRNTPGGTQYTLRAFPIDLDQHSSFSTDLTVRGNEALAALGVSFSLTS